MALLGFTVGREKILDGTKRQTIRALRKHPVKEGEKLYLYWKLRTKRCQLLGVTKCIETFFITPQWRPIFLEEKDVWRIDRQYGPNNFSGYTMMFGESMELAIQDGFKIVPEMLRWLANQYGELNGNRVFQVIRWAYPLMR